MRRAKKSSPQMRNSNSKWREEVIVKKYLTVPYKILLQHDDAPKCDIDAPMYTIDKLRVLSDDLKGAKNLLDRLYFGREKGNWLRISGHFDLYKSLRKYISEKYNVQLGSNAWLKYYEIYCDFGFHLLFAEMLDNTAIDHIPESKKITAFFNAELPGAALCAFNHYMKTVADISYRWYASSLVDTAGESHGTTALSDVYGLVSENRENWLMDENNNGDATDIKNLRDFAAKIGPSSPVGGVHFYSHDAGMDVSNDYNNQETINAKLHLGCAIAGFMTMRLGAIFVAKQYTCLETLTWNLIIIYSSLFDKFYLYKPLTSRPHNSEIYLIGIGYRGISNDLLNCLIAKLENFNMEPLLSSTHVNVRFGPQLGAILEFSAGVFGAQIDFLNESVSLYNKYKYKSNDLVQKCSETASTVQEKWLNDHKIVRINSRDYLPALKDRI
jgi:cap2 methyltransferase